LIFLWKSLKSQLKGKIMQSQLLKVIDESGTLVGYLVDLHGYKYIPKVEFDSMAPIEIFNKYKFKLSVSDTEVIKGDANV